MIYLSLDKTYIAAGESFKIGVTDPTGSIGDTHDYTVSGPGITVDNFIGETSLSGTIALGNNDTGFKTFNTKTDFPTGDDYITLTISSSNALNDMKLKVYSSYHYQTIDTKVSLTDTFDIWRKKTNSFIARLDSIENSTNELKVQTITANGINNAYTLSFTATSTNPYFFDVNIDGITQNPLDAYTIDDTNNAIIFSEIPEEDAIISIIHQYSFGASFSEIESDFNISGDLNVGGTLTIEASDGTPVDVKSRLDDTYTKAETDQIISDLIADAPAALDTLNELAEAIGDDPDFLQGIFDRLDVLEFVPVDITSFTSSPTTTLYEFAGSINYNLTFNWAVNKTPDTLSLTSPFSSPSIGTGDTSYIEPAFTVTNTDGEESVYTWTLNATDSQGSDSSSKIIRWVYPFFYGVDSNDLSGGTGIENLTKSVSRRGDKTFLMNPDWQFIYFAYPASYGDLSIILDGNGFNVTSSFTQYTANVTPPISGVARSYNIYKFNSLTQVNQNYQFKF